jgi:hypothetical protein
MNAKLRRANRRGSKRGVTMTDSRKKRFDE